MSSDQNVVCRPLQPRNLWGMVGFGAVGAGLAAGRSAVGAGFTDGWVLAGLIATVAGIACLHPASARVTADADGLRSRTVLRRRNVPWRDIADLRVYVQYARSQEIRRVSVVQRDGHKWRLPLPVGARGPRYEAEFDAKLAAMRALHRQHVTPQSSHVPVISKRTAGRGGPAAPLVMGVLLLIAAGVSAWMVPVVNSTGRAWKAAAPCTAGTPAAERAECLSTVPAVIARTTVGHARQRSWLYFSDGEPLRRLSVSEDGARGFHSGDKVELTVWRHEVREVTGAHHVWRDHFVGARTPAVLAALCVLVAGFPGAHALLRRRGRKLAADEVLPSVLPFAAALLGTALWLLPLCYFHPTNPFDSPASITWAVAGSLATLVMLTAAWRDTRLRTPAGAAGSKVTMEKTSDDEVFLAARFLEPTDYNPYDFGTHVVLGGGPPAVVPHPGPGRFAARRIPVERLTVGDVRRVRGSDGDTVPRGWHVAELDDAGRPVRLAAAPADLARIIKELAPAPQPH